MDKQTTTCPVCHRRYEFTHANDRCPVCCPKDEPEEVFEDYELVDEPVNDAKKATRRPLLFLLLLISISYAA